MFRLIIIALLLLVVGGFAWLAFVPPTYTPTQVEEPVPAERLER